MQLCKASWNRSDRTQICIGVLIHSGSGWMPVHAKESCSGQGVGCLNIRAGVAIREYGWLYERYRGKTIGGLSSSPIACPRTCSRSACGSCAPSAFLLLVALRTDGGASKRGRREQLASPMRSPQHCLCVLWSVCLHHDCSFWLRSVVASKERSSVGGWVGEWGGWGGWGG